MAAIEWAGFAVGIVLYLATAVNVVKTLVVPRRVRVRLTPVPRAVRTLFLWVANRFDDYNAKDRILAFQGPVMVLVVLAFWLLRFWFAFALILWPLIDASFLEALRESDSSLLTLGIFAADTLAPNLIYFTAAATGLIVIALMIAYLPTLYDSFQRRETLVTMLQSRAGVPAWGPEILWRHHMSGIVGNLGDFYTEWERWAADVAESHTNYPVLINFRSPHPLRSWIVGLLAVLDSAAIYHALCPAAAPTQARLCLRMGFICLREIADTIGVTYDPDPYPDDPIDLTFEEFKAGIARMEDFPRERSLEEAWMHFKGWRINYEKISYAIADYIVAPPGPWSGERHHLPGMVFVPMRPADRIAGEKDAKVADKIDPAEWRLHG
jgi:hypothetical protein